MLLHTQYQSLRLSSDQCFGNTPNKPCIRNFALILYKDRSKVVNEEISFKLRVRAFKRFNCNQNATCFYFRREIRYISFRCQFKLFRMIWQLLIRLKRMEQFLNAVVFRVGADLAPLSDNEFNKKL